MSEYDLLGAWFHVADWVVYQLMRDGSEGIVLKPLASYPKAATLVALSASASSSYRHRKIAACLAGWIRRPESNLLGQFFRQEAECDRRLPKNSLSRLDSQSVVEDIVFSAAMWARNKHTRSMGLEVLRKVVERTLAGDYWNSSSYAIAALWRHKAEGIDKLLNRFQQFAARGKVEHPSRPSLTQEAEFARNLAAKDPNTLNAVESSLDEKDNAATKAKLDEDSQAAIDELLHAAKKFEV